MDRLRFEALTRWAGRQPSRRAVLAAAAAALLPGRLTAQRADDPAGLNPIGFFCKNDADCRDDGVCIRAQPGDRLGRCKPASGRALCGGLGEVCRLARRDHGGRCCEDLVCRDGRCGLPGRLPGEPCVRGRQCLSGVCGDGVCACPGGGRPCGTACPDTDRDPANCGGCGVACGGAETCVDGRCAVGGGGGAEISPLLAQDCALADDRRARGCPPGMQAVFEDLFRVGDERYSCRWCVPVRDAVACELECRECINRRPSDAQIVAFCDIDLTAS